MAYRALYREYRPKCFSEMVGQNHITSVLKNQIVSHKTTHAYLLCGTRGTGKTTAARILARSLNCLEPVNGEACGKCEACRFSMAENCPDIVEIDAASNNGVDSVRDLIETCNIAPLKLQKRVVIIDEVHMLSASAFNALLKTLEEPPAHLVFILATTEPHKLLPTIVSRCQRFDFHRISNKDIQKNLSSILSKIGATVEEKGLQQIARSANGGMRDALSLLDQCLSFCGDHLMTEDVFNVLGNMDENFLMNICCSLLDCKADQAILELNKVIQRGRDLNVFVNDLASTFRSLLIVKTCGENARELLDFSSDTLNKYLTVSGEASPSHLLMSMRLLLDLQASLKYSSAPRTLIETTFVRIAKPQTQHSIESLEARIDILEKRLQNINISESSANNIPVTASVNESLTHSDSSAHTFTEAHRYEQTKTENHSEAVIREEAAPDKTVDKPKESTVSSETQPVQSKASEPTDCFSVWNALINLMLKELPLIHALASKGIPLGLSDNHLTVGFTEDCQVNLSTCSAPRTQTKVNELMGHLIPGCTVNFVKYSPQPVDSQTEKRLKDMFGDKLEIKDD